MGEAAVFLITGPSAVGKSTVGRLLAARSRRGVHLEGDLFRRCIVSGREEMTPSPSDEALAQLRLRYRVGAAAAEAYADAGFTVAWEDVVAGPMLEECLGLLRRPVRLVVLLADVGVLARRDSGRGATGYRAFSVEQLHDLFASGTPRIGLWLDTSRRSADETVDDILGRWPPP